MTFRINQNRLAELEYYFATEGAEALDPESLAELIRLLQKTVLNQREKMDKLVRTNEKLMDATNFNKGDLEN